MLLKKVLIGGLITAAAVGGLAGPASASRGRGADDPVSHVRHGRGGDDLIAHVRHVPGADDAASHARRGRGADDGASHR